MCDVPRVRVPARVVGRRRRRRRMGRSERHAPPEYRRSTAGGATIISDSASTSAASCAIVSAGSDMRWNKSRSEHHQHPREQQAGRTALGQSGVRESNAQEQERDARLCLGAVDGVIYGIGVL